MFTTNWHHNLPYRNMLQLIGRLSKLFSDSEIPYIHYRITENLFCKYFGARNLSRSDIAYDAQIGDIGIGIKTFTIPNNDSIEKVAEFNSLSPILRQLNGEELAHKLAEYRNERMNVANTLYNIHFPLYHIVGRKKEKLVIFNSPYDFVDTQHIHITTDNPTSLKFHDDTHEYVFNKSKSVLMKRFIIPEETLEIPIEIIDDPYALLEHLDFDKSESSYSYPYVILPLFSTRKNDVALTNNEGKWVPEKSGINQWNAGGRPRDPNEIYIPIPHIIHEKYPDFFPCRDKIFTLRLPDNTSLQAKVCQEGNKALMSNPNKALGEWLLRKILKVPENELVTIHTLDKAGFDSLIIYKISPEEYAVDVSYSESFTME